MERFKLIPASHLFLIKENKILLSRRFNTGWQDGNYSVPAGHLDGNETVTLGMIREAGEEIGVTIKPEDLKVVHTTHRLSGKEERVDFFLTAEDWQGEIKNMEPNKCDDLSWFSMDALPENTLPYIKSAIENYRQGKTFSEFGWE